MQAPVSFVSTPQAVQVFSSVYAVWLQGKFAGTTSWESQSECKNLCPIHQTTPTTSVRVENTDQDYAGLASLNHTFELHGETSQSNHLILV